ncbi:MAG: globin-coupled sensor protein [Polyangiaceae bacterium]
MSWLRGKRPLRTGRIEVTDRAVRARFEFQRLTEADLGIVATWADVCNPMLPRLSERFYAHVMTQSETRGILEKHTTVTKQRPVLERYLATLFTGVIDDAWVEFRRHVGRRHDEIDLDSSYYLAIYENIQEDLVAAVVAAGAQSSEVKQFSAAMERLLRADAGLVLTAMTDSRRQKLEQEHERRLASTKADEVFLGELTRVARGLADRDLTVRAAEPPDPEHKRLQGLLNGALGDLSLALRQVVDASEQVKTAASEVTAGSQANAQAASEQAGALEEISASLEEITQTSKQSAATAEMGRVQADEAASSVQKGVHAIEELSEAIGRIKSSSDETARIVKTIDEIAFQTNLLALNAAVEAARAGDAGKGFAVVAEEVRNLAIRSAEAARTTGRMIDESRKSAGSGVSAHLDVSNALTAIKSNVEAVRAFMEQISQSAVAQKKNVTQISSAVDEMTKTTQQTAATAEESASAAEELSGQSDSLTDLIGSFRTDEGGTRRRHLRSVPPIRDSGDTRRRAQGGR